MDFVIAKTQCTCVQVQHRERALSCHSQNCAVGTCNKSPSKCQTIFILALVQKRCSFLHSFHTTFPKQYSLFINVSSLHFNIPLHTIDVTQNLFILFDANPIQMLCNIILDHSVVRAFEHSHTRQCTCITKLTLYD